MDREAQPAMACPLDRTPLVMAERQGIEIDYCPTCRGVWLDRGELDKIVERSAGPPPAAAAAGPWGGGDRHRFEHDHRNRGHGKRRKSFLEELFD